jgi:ribosomal protein S18 acetylase RimI-like enzyme
MTANPSEHDRPESEPGRELDFSDPSGDRPEALSRDRVPVRSLAAGDLSSLARIDRRITGRDRTAYFERKVAEALGESGIRVSLVAEVDGWAAGYVMARVDFGEFGRVEPTAVIDTIGVDPGYGHQGVGHALMSQLVANLAMLRIERIRTEVGWDDFALIGFLRTCGFKPSQRIAFSRAVA